MNRIDQKISFLNIPVSALTMQETIDVIDEHIGQKKQLHHVVINAGKVVSMQKDPVLFRNVVSSDIINADGQSIVWACRFLGLRIPERVAGIDLMINLLSLAYRKKYKCFFFGAEERIVKQVVEKVSREYSPEIIAGYRNGYYNEEEETSIAEQITKSGAQILFVAITSPKKEEFLMKNKALLSHVNFFMGVGGSFDVFAGFTKRAPRWMQNAGLEWFARFIQEPRRMWRRYLIGNSKFIALVLKAKFSRENH